LPSDLQPNTGIEEPLLFLHSITIWYFKKKGGFFELLLAVFRSTRMFEENEFASCSLYFASESPVRRSDYIILPPQAMTHCVKSEMFFDESKHRLSPCELSEVEYELDYIRSC